MFVLQLHWFNEIAKTRPEDYVKAVTELFDNGQTTLGKWKLTTTNREFNDMLSKAGFTDIQDDSSDWTYEDVDNLKKANELYSKNYQVSFNS